jgi:ornithine cyclodeaminase/alanine dehydrogenase
VVCQNLGNGLSDLVVAAAVADAAEAQDAGHRLDTTPA